MFIRENTRRELNPEFKDEAGKLVINTCRLVSTVARELAVKGATLGRWVNLFKASQDAGEAGITETEKAELLRLRKENADLKLDRAFPKSLPLLRPGSLGYERQAFALMLVEKTTFSIVRMVRMVRLLAVSRSAYYAWLGRSPSERVARRENFEHKVA